MKTDALIDLLARGPIAVEAGEARRRFSVALGWGALGAVVLMATLLGVRPDLFLAMSDPMFWVKLGFVTVMAAFALPANLRLARPGARLGRLPWGVAAPDRAHLAAGCSGPRPGAGTGASRPAVGPDLVRMPAEYLPVVGAGLRDADVGDARTCAHPVAPGWRGGRPAVGRDRRDGLHPALPRNERAISGSLVRRRRRGADGGGSPAGSAHAALVTPRPTCRTDHPRKAPRSRHSRVSSRAVRPPPIPTLSLP
jgi:hypothetical protein